MKKQNNQQNPKSTKKQELFLKTRNGNIMSNQKQTTPKAEAGYCNKATQSSPLTHSQSHKAQNTVEHTGVKQRKAWTKEEIREVIPCYICIAGSILQKITRKCMKYGDNVTQNAECTWMPKKLLNQKNYITKHKKIMEMKVKEIERTARKTGESPRRKRGRKARTLRY
jgi:hypothetical protein